MPVGHGSIKGAGARIPQSIWVIKLACALPLSSLQCILCRPDEVCLLFVGTAFSQVYLFSQA